MSCEGIPPPLLLQERIQSPSRPSRAEQCSDAANPGRETTSENTSKLEASAGTNQHGAVEAVPGRLSEKVEDTDENLDPFSAADRQPPAMPLTSSEENNFLRGGAVEQRRPNTTDERQVIHLGLLPPREQVQDLLVAAVGYNAAEQEALDSILSAQDYEHLTCSAGTTESYATCAENAPEVDALDSAAVTSSAALLQLPFRSAAAAGSSSGSGGEVKHADDHDQEDSPSRAKPAWVAKATMRTNSNPSPSVVDDNVVQAEQVEVDASGLSRAEQDEFEFELQVEADPKNASCTSLQGARRAEVAVARVGAARSEDEDMTPPGSCTVQNTDLPTTLLAEVAAAERKMHENLLLEAGNGNETNDVELIPLLTEADLLMHSSDEAPASRSSAPVPAEMQNQGASCSSDECLDENDKRRVRFVMEPEMCSPASSQLQSKSSTGDAAATQEQEGAVAPVAPAPISENEPAPASRGEALDDNVPVAVDEQPDVDDTPSVTVTITTEAGKGGRRFASSSSSSQLQPVKARGKGGAKGRKGAGPSSSATVRQVGKNMSTSVVTTASSSSAASKRGASTRSSSRPASTTSRSPQASPAVASPTNKRGGSSLVSSVTAASRSPPPKRGHHPSNTNGAAPGSGTPSGKKASSVRPSGRPTSVSRAESSSRSPGKQGVNKRSPSPAKAPNSNHAAEREGGQLKKSAEHLGGLLASYQPVVSKLRQADMEYLQTLTGVSPTADATSKNVTHPALSRDAASGSRRTSTADLYELTRNGKPSPQTLKAKKPAANKARARVGPAVAVTRQTPVLLAQQGASKSKTDSPLKTEDQTTNTPHQDGNLFDEAVAVDEDGEPDAPEACGERQDLASPATGKVAVFAEDAAGEQDVSHDVVVGELSCTADINEQLEQPHLQIVVDQSESFAEQDEAAESAADEHAATAVFATVETTRKYQQEFVRAEPKSSYTTIDENDYGTIFGLDTIDNSRPVSSTASRYRVAGDRVPVLPAPQEHEEVDPASSINGNAAAANNDPEASPTGTVTQEFDGVVITDLLRTKERAEHYYIGSSSHSPADNGSTSETQQFAVPCDALAAGAGEVSGGTSAENRISAQEVPVPPQTILTPLDTCENNARHFQYENKTGERPTSLRVPRLDLSPVTLAVNTSFSRSTSPAPLKQLVSPSFELSKHFELKPFKIAAAVGCEQGQRMVAGVNEIQIGNSILASRTSCTQNHDNWSCSPANANDKVREGEPSKSLSSSWCSPTPGVGSSARVLLGEEGDESCGHGGAFLENGHDYGEPVHDDRHAGEEQDQGEQSQVVEQIRRNSREINAEAPETLSSNVLFHVSSQSQVLACSSSSTSPSNPVMDVSMKLADEQLTTSTKKFKQNTSTSPVAARQHDHGTSNNLSPARSRKMGTRSPAAGRQHGGALMKSQSPKRAPSPCSPVLATQAGKTNRNKVLADGENARKHDQHHHASTLAAKGSSGSGVKPTYLAPANALRGTDASSAFLFVEDPYSAVASGRRGDFTPPVRGSAPFDNNFNNKLRPSSVVTTAKKLQPALAEPVRVWQMNHNSAEQRAGAWPRYSLGSASVLKPAVLPTAAAVQPRSMTQAPALLSRNTIGITRPTAAGLTRAVSVPSFLLQPFPAPGVAVAVTSTSKQFVANNAANIKVPTTNQPPPAMSTPRTPEQKTRASTAALAVTPGSAFETAPATDVAEANVGVAAATENKLKKCVDHVVKSSETPIGNRSASSGAVGFSSRLPTFANTVGRLLSAVSGSVTVSKTTTSAPSTGRCQTPPLPAATTRHTAGSRLKGQLPVTTSVMTPPLPVHVAIENWSNGLRSSGTMGTTSEGVLPSAVAKSSAASTLVKNKGALSTTVSVVRVKNKQAPASRSVSPAARRSASPKPKGKKVGGASPANKQIVVEKSGPETTTQQEQPQPAVIRSASSPNYNQQGSSLKGLLRGKKTAFPHLQIRDTSLTRLTRMNFRDYRDVSPVLGLKSRIAGKNGGLEEESEVPVGKDEGHGMPSSNLHLRPQGMQLKEKEQDEKPASVEKPREISLPRSASRTEPEVEKAEQGASLTQYSHALKPFKLSATIRHKSKNLMTTGSLSTKVALPAVTLSKIPPLHLATSGSARLRSSSSPAKQEDEKTAAPAIVVDGSTACVDAATGDKDERGCTSTTSSRQPLNSSARNSEQGASATASKSENANDEASVSLGAMSPGSFFGKYNRQFKEMNQDWKNKLEEMEVNCQKTEEKAAAVATPTKAEDGTAGVHYSAEDPKLQGLQQQQQPPLMYYAEAPTSAVVPTSSAVPIIESDEAAHEDHHIVEKKTAAGSSKQGFLATAMSSFFGGGSQGKDEKDQISQSGGDDAKTNQKPVPVVVAPGAAVCAHGTGVSSVADEGDESNTFHPLLRTVETKTSAITSAATSPVLFTAQTALPTSSTTVVASSAPSSRAGQQQAPTTTAETKKNASGLKAPASLAQASSITLPRASSAALAAVGSRVKETLNNATIGRGVVKGSGVVAAAPAGEKEVPSLPSAPDVREEDEVATTETAATHQKTGNTVRFQLPAPGIATASAPAFASHQVKGSTAVAPLSFQSRLATTSVSSTSSSLKLTPSASRLGPVQQQLIRPELANYLFNLWQTGIPLTNTQQQQLKLYLETNYKSDEPAAAASPLGPPSVSELNGASSPVVAPALSMFRPDESDDPVDHAIYDCILGCREKNPGVELHVQKLSQGMYRFGLRETLCDIDPTVQLRSRGKNTLVRVGGGWEPLRNYLAKKFGIDMET
ncbi:unnamed protein product [Amoebophrya sp. A120]|nr:unnamed protein product [Amoebophrya sp. A120]|eukprot:GSA120T00011312001.1